MKIKIILLLIFFVSCATPRNCPDLVHNSVNKITETADGELYTGRCMTYENDIKRSVQQYINGKDYGKWVFYFPNGKVQIAGLSNIKSCDFQKASWPKVSLTQEVKNAASSAHLCCFKG